MAIIPQQQLFGWEDIERLGDLERLRLVVEHLPDESLMRALEQQRGRGRNDYPVRAVWNSILAGVVYEHVSVESLRRELKRNAQLRRLCGFEVVEGEEAVPPSWAYSRFLASLMGQMELVEEMFDELVESLREELPGFGRSLAVDGKAVRTHARPRRRAEQTRERDGRRDVDADFGEKRSRGVREDGTLWEKVTRWFGYKLHLVVDAQYELPVGYEVTRASCAEQPVAHRLLDELDERHPELVEGCEHFIGDKGYDDGKLIRRLWDVHEIKPVIAIRALWGDGEATRVVSGMLDVVYDYKGTVYCHCPSTGRRSQMAYGGFERTRGTLKYRCPALHYGFECAGRALCGVHGSVRIPLSEDRRVFTPLARSSYRWKGEYKKRTAAERVNSRFDVSFGFERHFIRGLDKMKLRCGLALVVMLGMALGRVRAHQREKLRSLVAAA